MSEVVNPYILRRISEALSDQRADFRARVSEQLGKYDSSETEYRAALVWVLGLIDGVDR
jgi:hypothetical protein